MMQSVSLLQIKYLYQAVTTGSIRAAADKLNIAPSAISRQISQLEKNIGMLVIERNRRGVISTDAGHLMLSYYKEQLGLEDIYNKELSQLRGLTTGHLTLAVGEGFIPELISKVLAQFGKIHPNISISLRVNSTNDVIREIEMCEAHIGLVYHPPKRDNIRSHIIKSAPIEAIVNIQHSINKYPTSISLEQLLEHPILFLDKQFGIQQMLELAVFQKQLSIQSRLTTNSFTAIKHFAMAGTGIAALPKFVVAKEITAGLLTAIPIDNDLLKSGKTHVITKVGRTLPPCTQALLTMLKRFLHDE